MRNENYAFAVAKIRSLESKLLKPTQLERLIDGPSANIFFEALADSSYSKFFSSYNQVDQFQHIINLDMIETKKTLIKIAPDAKLLEWIWLAYDFSNLKYLLKNHLAGNKIDPKTLPELGNYHPLDFENYLLKQHKSNIHPDIIQAVDHAKNAYSQNSNTISIDTILDQTYFKILSDQVNILDSIFVKNLIIQKIDLYNIGVLLRKKQFDNSSVDIKDFIVSGGSIPIEKILKNFKLDIPVIASDPVFNEYKKILLLSHEYYNEHQSYLVFEKITHKYFIDKLRDSRYLAFGIEPLIAYWMAKYHQAKILRIIMISKMSNIPAKHIHEQIY